MVPDSAIPACVLRAADSGWGSASCLRPHDTGVCLALPLAASDCGFLITSAVALPNGDYEVCVQSNDQVSAQTWVVTDGPNQLGTGNQPNICWTFSVSNPLFFIEHTVVECGTCTQAIFILGDEHCPPDIVQTEVQNCNLETSIGIDITNLGIPYVITFGDGSPAQQSTAGEITHNYGQPGLYDICLSYFVPGNEIGYVTCCYPVEIVLPQACICPEDFVDLVSVEPCTWAASLSFDLDAGIFPIVVDFGDGTTDTVTTSSVVHEYPGPGVYNLCFRFEPFPGDTLECCELINIPGCCLDASFTLAPDYANGWESCLNPTYIVTPTACLNPVIEVTHIWEFSDGTIFNGPFPPPHVFTNFVDVNGEVCVTHTIICCDESVSDTVCADHFPGAYLGTAGGQLELDDILPSTGQNVLTFIKQNASNPSLPLLIDGLLIVNIDGSFVGGTWNMGRNSEILVRGNSQLPRRNFSLYSTTIRSAVRIPNFPACCRWKGIRSERLTDIRMYSANIKDANYAIHYPTFTAGSPFPNILSANSNFENNFYVIKSNRQHVVFSNFNGNTLNGTSLSPHVCGCTAVNAIDFRDVSGVTTVNIDDKGFGRNEILNYERGFNFQNTRLTARGFNIHDLREYDPSIGVPNNPDGQTALGIDFLWWLSSNSSLEVDRISFTDFDEQDALSYAVRDRVFRGRHILRANASSQGSINTAGIAGGYDISIFSPARLEGGSIIRRNTLLTDGTGNAGLGFGITGNFFNTANNLFEIRDNDITVATGSNNPLNGGIVMTSTEDFWNAFSIENNTINLALTDGVGIGVYGARGYCVRKNWIGNASDATGIQLSGGGDATVECNRVLFKPTGIAALLSDENTYSGNSLSGNVNDMHFTGDCRGPAGSRIQWNQFDFSWAPSLVWDNDARTGVQEHNSYNFWTGQGNQGGGSVEVQHNAPPFSAGIFQSRFHRPSNAAVGSIHFPITVWG
ncbi:MAG: NosD domain-containing protein [Saprospiraceae bacterium]